MSPARAHTLQAALAAARLRIGAVDARVLLAALTGRDAAYLIAHAAEEFAAEQALTYDRWVARRAAGEPVAYIVGWREFYGRRFRVTADVLIPRPETELLVDVAVSALRGRDAPRVLDLGTGSGCIAITLAIECAGAHVTAVDASHAALEIAAANARELGARVEWLHGDWLDAVAGRRFDLVVSNPPYIAGGDPHLGQGDLRFEPAMALTPGRDGLAAIRRIVADASACLAPAGSLWFEHGYEQGAASRALLESGGYVAIETHRDLAGIERVTGGTLPAGSEG